MRSIALAATIAAVLAPSRADACGGFFCNNQTPIDQSKERILFALTEGGIEAHIQIFYSGLAADFAWVVPVPTQPSLFISTDELFTQLSQRTQPFFQLSWREEGTCIWDTYFCGGFDDVCLAAADTDRAGNAPPGEPGVEVVEQRQVGPYDSAVLRASSAELLTDWLTTNGYDLPATLAPVLAPYVASESYFVALKLQNDKSTGDIAPIGLRYAGDKPMIPIQLTSVAATPDMRLEVYVAGPHRAVPGNYLHVTINEAAIDWLSNGDNYEAVITQAADEAGGHAFATDFSGPSALMRGVLYSDGRFNTARLRGIEDPAQFVNELRNQGFPRNATLLNLMMVHIPMPQSLRDRGLDDRSFYNCLSCYSAELAGFDFQPGPFVDDLEAVIIEPLRHAQQTLDGTAALSRLTSSVSPEEMTLDPQFVFNRDMGEVSAQHRADLVFVCGSGTNISEAPRRIELADGRSIWLPSSRWLEEHGVSVDDYLVNLGAHAAATIEQTGETGQPRLLVDNTGAINASIDRHNRRVRRSLRDDNGSFCGAGGSSVLAGLLALFALARRRRR